MSRKLVVWPVLLATLAMAGPSMASAAEATYPAGTRAPIGQQLTMTGSNITLTSGTVGRLTCDRLSANVKVTVNNGTTFKAAGQDEWPEQRTCFVEEESRRITVTDFVVTELVASEANGPSGAQKKGTMSFGAFIDFPVGFGCNFTGTKVPFTFVSTNSPIVLTFFKGAGITATGGCGSSTLDASFSIHGPGSTTTPVVGH